MSSLFSRLGGLLGVGAGQIYRSVAGNYLFEDGTVRFSGDPMTENRMINLCPDFRYQTVVGFGSALTESVAINYAKMSPEVKKEFLTACFDPEDGAGLNFCRSTMNSCDFSAGQYDYCAKNDKTLSSFSVAHDDEAVIPLLKDAVAASKGELKLFFSPWSPCAWMKENGSMRFGGKLKESMYPVWAEYFARFIEEYRKRGIEFEALTVQNEPHATQTWESCFYSARQQVAFVSEHLLPTLKKHGFSPKILVWDHNKEHITDWAVEAATEPGIWGLGFHWYSGDHFDALSLVHDRFPQLNLCATEFCCGGTGDDWGSAEAYAHEIIGDLDHHAVSVTDWNLLLDEKTGGPFHARIGGCKSPVGFDAETGKAVYHSTFYVLSHFSRFVKRGAVRIGTSVWKAGIEAVAFENPDGSRVAVIRNGTESDEDARLRCGEKCGDLSLPAHSLTTVVLGGSR